MRRLTLTSRWFLHCAAVTCCFLVLLGQETSSVNAARATSLFIKSKTSTPATTTTEAAATNSTAEPDTEDAEESTDDTEVVVMKDGTKKHLTGIPQIDYVYDPNLPRELNGFNLSSYPFLDSVPDDDDILFKCDEKLKDGFYSDVQYGCQLYHHCLSGFRHDFLCANFTAFDQKTFICHFVSEVDCKNSHKYWSKNDDLYKATTARPVPTVATTTTTTTTPAPHRAGGGRPRRPYRRRRPQVEYYDDEYDDDYYYEEAPKRRRKQRPRTRRPIQAEYDDEYAEELPPKRSHVAQDDYDYDRRMERPRQSERRRPAYDDRRSFDEERRRPADERRSFDDRRPNRKNTFEDRRRPAGGPQNDFDQPRKPARVRDEDLDDYERPRARHPEAAAEAKVKPSGTGGTPSLFAPRVPPKIRRPVPLNARDKYEYNPKSSPGSGSQQHSPASATAHSSTTEKPLFDDEDYYADDYPVESESEEPRRPQGTTTTKAPTTTTTTSTSTAPPPPHRKPEIITDADYYDDEYEDDPLPPVRGKYNPSNSADQGNSGNGGRQSSHPSSAQNKAQSFSQSHAQKTPPHQQSHQTPTSTSPPHLPQSPSTRTATTEQPPAGGGGSRGRDRYEEEDRFSDRFNSRDTLTTTTRPSPFNPKYEIQISAFNNNNNNKQAAQQQQEEPQYDDEQDKPVAVRVVKRPFLPSRSGNPNLPRGLQPVGHLNPFQHAATTTTSTTPAPAPAPRNPPQYYDSKLEEIYNTDFDVTLNDALNPTLKPFTTRGAGPLAVPQSSNPFVERNRFAGSRYDSLEAPSSFRAQQSRVRPLNVYQQPYSPVALSQQRRRSGQEAGGYLRAQASSHYHQRAARAGDYYGY